MRTFTIHAFAGALRPARLRALVAPVLVAPVLAAPVLAAPALAFALAIAAGSPALAQNQNDSVRLVQLEEQVRLLNGQVEGLQFQLTQLQALLENMQADLEFRFQQLEGGGSGNGDAAVQPGGAMPSGGLPQIPSQDHPDQGALDLSQSGGGGELNEEGAIVLGAPEQPLGSLPANELDGAGPALGQPLHLDYDPGDVVTDADAEAQFRAGYEAAVNGDYAFAEDQLRQFVALFPDHPRAPEATNWLGGALIQRGAYDEAADILLTGFESYPGSDQAPDILLNLGVALAGAGERDTACRTFGEVQRRYPNQPPAFLDRVSQQMTSTQC